VRAEARAQVGAQVRAQVRADVRMDDEREVGPDLAPGSGLGRDEVAIARRLALSARRSIGLLPVGAPFGPAAGEAPLLDALARALTDFVSGEVATVGPWRTWDTGHDPRARAESEAARQDDDDDGDGGRIVPEPGDPRRVRLVPSEVGDQSAAGFALRRALTRHLPNLSRVLIDLADYAPPGVMPGIAERLDGVVLLVRVRRDRWQRVAELTRMLPVGQNLGVILIG
jgi:hypothetical protein